MSGSEGMAGGQMSPSVPGHESGDDADDEGPEAPF
jgi:hypothetical protein